MQFLPDNILSTLEYDRVLDLIAERCMTSMARQQVLSLVPREDFNWISGRLGLVEEILRVLHEDVQVLPGTFPSVRAYLSKLSVEGYVLDREQIVEVLNLLQISTAAASAVHGLDEEEYHNLREALAGLTDFSAPVKHASRILDHEGNVRPDASPELKRISAQLNSKRTEVERAFQKALRVYSDKGWLADTGESLRNGRRVLAVKAENKRQIRGIMHDQSASGKTTFLEPEDVIELNNDIFDLHASRRAEEYRLLKSICDSLRPLVHEIETAEYALVLLDELLAIARFARSIDGIRPKLSESAGLRAVQAYHPLLKYKNEQLGRATIPFDLELNADMRILLLSGPNAGGKSILMKSVGLLQAMIQSGILVPVDADSEFGIFGKIFVDMGDRQSIDDDLSTYSSRLLDLKTFIESADNRTMVLIDEFGSGTDPKLGGAIAEGALDALNKLRIFGVITTHYSELKAYAHQAKGIGNGAMIFDKESMRPTYVLRVGKPGSSFALEVARRVGLPQGLLKYARKRAGKYARAMEDLISELDSQKLRLEEDKRKMREQQKQLEQLSANYEAMQNELTAQRKRMRLEQKERDYEHLSRLNRELEKSVRKARESENLAEAKKQLEKVKAQRAATRESLTDLSQQLYSGSGESKKDWQPGDAVRIRGAQDAGKVESIDKKYANIIVGQLRLRVPVKDLEPARDPIEINPRRSVTTDVKQQVGGSFNSMLDLRGMRARDAQGVLERFLDAALLSGVSWVEIVHGKGTGALRKLVAEKVAEYPVTSIENPEDSQGGSGSTIIRF